MITHQRRPLAFVTGARGFLGTNLVLELQAQGWDVIALHRNAELRQTLQFSPHFTAVRADLRDYDSVRALIPDGLDALFHVGSLITYWRLRDDEQYHTNVEATKHLVQCAIDKQVRKFIHTSTVLTYDYSSGQRITESTPLNGERSWVGYIRTKRLGEMEVERGIEQGLDAVILHPGTIMGAHDYHTWSKLFVAIKSGSPLFGVPKGMPSWCHARAVAKAHVAAVTRGGCGEHYLLGGVDASFLEVANAICGLLARTPFRRPRPAWAVKSVSCIGQLISHLTKEEPLITPELADVMQNTVVCSSEKAIRELGYEPSSLHEMLTDCYTWMVATNRI